MVRNKNIFLSKSIQTLKLFFHQIDQELFVNFFFFFKFPKTAVMHNLQEIANKLEPYFLLPFPLAS